MNAPTSNRFGDTPDVNDLWAEVVAGALASPGTTGHLLRLCTPVSMHDNTLLLEAPNDFTRREIEGRLRDDVTGLLMTALGRPATYYVGLAEPTAAGTAPAVENPRPVAPDPDDRAGALVRLPAPTPRDGVDVAEPGTDLAVLGSDGPTALALPPAGRPGSAMALPSGPAGFAPRAGRDGVLARDRVSAARLNDRYTFDSFVVGPNNRLATAAARAVAEQPGRAYSPLFVYGNSGLGKTHLLHAIGNYAMSMWPDMQVRYVSTEEFTNDFINSIRDNAAAFQRRYRSVDLLLIDDIQFIVRAERTQEEFFHTFNALHHANKQIVITSDAPPRQLSGLVDRLRSRFEWGLQADVQAPDLETRTAILRKKAAADHLAVDDDVLDLIASRVTTNVRELEGALIRVSAWASLNGVPLTPDLVRNVLRDIVPGSDTPTITIASIKAAVCEYYSVEEADLTGSSRTRSLVQVRQVGMFLCRELTDASLPKIGEAFHRDHTTVLYAVQKVRDGMSTKPQLYQAIDDLTRTVRGNQAR